MYEELQQRKKPKAPKSIRAAGVKGLLGVLSPSKVFARQGALNQTDEERTYFSEEWKYRLYKRRVSQEEWRAIYRRYRREQHPERAQEWEKKCDEAAKKAIEAIKLLIGE